MIGIAMGVCMGLVMFALLPLVLVAGVALIVFGIALAILCWLYTISPWLALVGLVAMLYTWSKHT